MNLEQKIEAILSEILSPEYFVIEILYKNKGALPKLQILLDGDKGVSIDICAEVSRKLSAILEEQDLIPTAYNLEVSSSGIDTPLKFERQYAQHIGRKLKIRMKDETEVTGTLLSVQDKDIEINEDTGNKRKKTEVKPSLKISFDDIKQTNVLISFGK